MHYLVASLCEIQARCTGSYLLALALLTTRCSSRHAVPRGRKKATLHGDTGRLPRWRLATFAEVLHSMLVDPTGKVQTELDEKEGIAFGQVGV